MGGEVEKTGAWSLACLLACSLERQLPPPALHEAPHGGNARPEAHAEEDREEDLWGICVCVDPGE